MMNDWQPAAENNAWCDGAVESGSERDSGSIKLIWIRTELTAGILTDLISLIAFLELLQQADSSGTGSGK